MNYQQRTHIQIRAMRHYAHAMHMSFDKAALRWCSNGLAAEWVCFEHEGFARTKSIAWWYEMGGDKPAPNNVAEAVDRAKELIPPTKVMLRHDGKYKKIVNRFWEVAVDV